jgi:hypothetical protein
VHFLAFAIALKAVIPQGRHAFFRKGGMPARRQAAFQNTENTLLIAIVAAFLDVILADLAQTRQIFIWEDNGRALSPNRASITITNWPDKIRHSADIHGCHGNMEEENQYR